VAYIGNDLQVAFSTYKNIDDISGSFDGVTTSFALLVNGVAPAPLPLNSNQCLISVGGVVQRPDDTGTEGFRLSGGNIVFSSAPNTAEDFFGVILAGADYVNAGANFPDGTLAAPSITFDQDNDTGYYRSGSGAVSFASNGVAAGTWSSAGVTAPALIPTGSSVPANGVYLPAANTVGVATNGVERVEFGTGEVVFNDGGANYDFRIEGDTNASLFFVDASAEAVGIGTTSPSTKLHVYDGAGGGASLLTQYDVLAVENDDTCVIQIISPTNKGGEIQFTDNSRSRGQIGYSHTDDALNFNTAGNERARIDSSGRLLVGTSTSRGTNAPTMVQSRSGSSIPPGYTVITGNEENAGGLILESTGTNSVSIIADPDNLRASSRINFSVDTTERMRITAVGELRQFSSSGAGAIGFASGNGASGNPAIVFSHSAGGIGGGTDSFRVNFNGDVRNTNNSYGAISDIKLKENIVDATSQWNDLKALQVRKFNFKEETRQETHTQIGLVAQEVELVSPGLVSESPDRDEDGNDLGTVTKSVNYSVLYMKAVKALQEAMERIETLEARLTAAGIE
jgi:hypothetical protein